MLPVCQRKLGFSFRSPALILPFKKDGTDLGWNISMHLKPTPVTSDTWPKLSQEQYLTLTLHRQGVHLVGQRFCTERVKFDYSFRGCLGHFRVSSWELQPQTCLSSLPVCQKERYFSIFKLESLSLFIIPWPPDAGRPVELPLFPSALAVPRFPGNDRRCCCGDGWFCVEWQSWEVLGDTTCLRNKVRT